MESTGQRPREKRAYFRPYQGWSWRGAIVDMEGIGAYSTGALMRGLGEPRTSIGEVYDFPALFWVWASSAVRPSQNPNEVIFPVESKFRVRDVITTDNARICICLEQESPDTEPNVDVAAEFRSWVANLPGSLPRSPIELVLTWCSPFAFQESEAQEGGGPRQVEARDYVEPSRYISDLTGLDESTVIRVLEATERYHQITGLSPVTPDESLLKEMEALKTLLSGGQTILDPAIKGPYLQLVTGLPKRTIQRVLNGEAAYCVGFGLQGLLG